MILLASAALAADPSPRPTLADDLCAPAGARAGVALTPTCDSVLLPLPRAAWYAAMVPWADEQHALLRLERAAHADELARRDAEVAYWRDIAARPVPVWERPGVAVSVGVVAGVGVTLGAAWALGQVAQ